MTRYPRFLRIPRNRRRSSSFQSTSESRVSSHRPRCVRHFRFVAEERERETEYAVSARKARVGLLSFINHTPITWKLRQRPRLTFAKCQVSSCRPAEYRANEKDTLLEIASERDAIDSALLSSSRFARAPRSAACRGSAEKSADTLRSLILQFALSSMCYLELTRRRRVRGPREPELERNPDRSQRALPPATSASTASSSTLVNVNSRTSASRHCRGTELLSWRTGSKSICDLSNYELTPAKVSYVVLIVSNYDSPRWVHCCLRRRSSKVQLKSIRSNGRYGRCAISSNGEISEGNGVVKTARQRCCCTSRSIDVYFIYTYIYVEIHTTESRDYARDARAVSHVHTSEPRPRCSCNCVCRLGMLEVVWRRLSGRTRCLVSLFSFPVSLIPFRSLSLSLSPFCSLFSPTLVRVPPNSPPFFFLPLTHLICLLPALASLFTSLSFSFCLQNPRWVSPSLPEGTLTPSLSLSLQKTKHSSSHSLFPCAFFRLLLLEMPRMYF